MIRHLLKLPNHARLWKPEPPDEALWCVRAVSPETAAAWVQRMRDRKDFVPKGERP
jgi:hypothetical protein